ncbi:hypothetical protein HPB51_018244 [Rhipicephalus microplus]|uniref:Uncharacterized protein n=1 Tax=Rhipicephalus microplus TaxID=6941 RepID=A0A9J6D6V4_RHIMP|nr:hypothetical protein HPB51_018244 [Rhipicephalus microplus]
MSTPVACIRHDDLDAQRSGGPLLRVGRELAPESVYAILRSLSTVTASKKLRYSMMRRGNVDLQMRPLETVHYRPASEMDDWLQEFEEAHSEALSTRALKKKSPSGQWPQSPSHLSNPRALLSVRSPSAGYCGFCGRCVNMRPTNAESHNKLVHVLDRIYETPERVYYHRPG